jgi:hypothetical protein
LVLRADRRGADSGWFRAAESRVTLARLIVDFLLILTLTVFGLLVCFALANYFEDHR